MEVRNQQNKSKFPVPQKKAAKSDYKIQKVSSHWIRGEMEFRGMIPLMTCVFFSVISALIRHVYIRSC